MKNQRALEESVILIKGAGEKASAVAYSLYRAGMTRIVMTDLPVPRAERRAVSFCEALIDWRKEIHGVVAQRTDPSMEMILECWSEGKIPVVADPGRETLQLVKPDVFIDGLMAKHNTGTRIRDAALVIALGPGFLAGTDCHLVVETNPASSDLGRVMSVGEAEENTAVPVSVMGLTMERLIRAPAEGRLVSQKQIGDRVNKDDIIGYVNSSPIEAQIPGCIWGLVRDGVPVKKGQKVGDIDPRGRRELCFEITPESRSIADELVKGIRSHLSR